MKTREWLLLETLNVVKRVLTKGEAKNSFVNQRIINSKKKFECWKSKKANGQRNGKAYKTFEKATC